MKASETSHERPVRSSIFESVELFDLSFVNAPDEATVAERLLDWHRTSVLSDPLPIVVTPNVDIVVQMRQEDQASAFEVARRCAVVLPDGAPIVWVSKLIGAPLSSRLAGSTVFGHWWPSLVSQQRRVAVLCSSEAVRDGLLSEYPDAHIVVAPMIDQSSESIERAGAAFAAEAAAVDAEFCVLGLGHPKDSLLANAALSAWPEGRVLPLILCLGGSAELYLGLRKRAPLWVQRCGLEWLVRFAQEPRRMFYRYFVRDLRFLPLTISEFRKRNK